MEEILAFAIFDLDFYWKITLWSELSKTKVKIKCYFFQGLGGQVDFSQNFVGLGWLGGGLYAFLQGWCLIQSLEELFSYPNIHLLLQTALFLSLDSPSISKLVLLYMYSKIIRLTKYLGNPCTIIFLSKIKKTGNGTLFLLNQLSMWLKWKFWLGKISFEFRNRGSCIFWTWTGIRCRQLCI